MKIIELKLVNNTNTALVNFDQVEYCKPSTDYPNTTVVHFPNKAIRVEESLDTIGSLLKQLEQQ